MYKKISDYGIIGNLYSIALIGLDGSIDWMCLPHIDSPSIFGALLDDKKGGRYSISPADEWDSAAEYIPGTNILRTRFRTGTGVMQITDFMPVCSCGNEEQEEERNELYRLIEIHEGRIRAEIVFDPRFDYARAATVIKEHGDGVSATGNDEVVLLSSSRKINITDNMVKEEWDLNKGEKVWLNLRFGDGEPEELDQEKAEKALKDTETYWRKWLDKSETGRTIKLGPYKDRVQRSALVLKLLNYEATGTIAAAATTSLPEEVGGVRNWDYRYTWVRDTSFTLQTLFSLGHLSESEGYIRWIEKLLSEHGAGKMQIMYGLRGEEAIPEYELDHLDGYRGSRPELPKNWRPHRLDALPYHRPRQRGRMTATTRHHRGQM